MPRPDVSLLSHNLPWRIARRHTVTVAGRFVRYLRSHKDAPCWRIYVSPPVGDELCITTIMNTAGIIKAAQIKRNNPDLVLAFYGFTEEEMHRISAMATDEAQLCPGIKLIVPPIFKEDRCQACGYNPPCMCRNA